MSRFNFGFRRRAESHTVEETSALEPEMNPWEKMANEMNAEQEMAEEELSQRLSDDKLTERSEEKIRSSKLDAFKNFFKADLQIKSGIADIAPKEEDFYNEESRIDYADKAYKKFLGMEFAFTKIIGEFNFGKQEIQEFFERGKEDFAIGKYSADAIQKLYQEKFTDMRPDFIEKVKKECVGYALFKDERSLLEEAKTVNELLHAYHSFIMNNESILQHVPILDQKVNNRNKCNINLRGDDSSLSRQVFDAISEDLDVGETEIIGADEHVMMMVRDRGHALTISAEPDVQRDDAMWVEYNVPKLCNREMIEALPGLSGYSENGARGVYGYA